MPTPDASSVPALELERVGRDYAAGGARGLLRGTTRALDAVDLVVRRGERWGLVGPNGSGKSTLLRLAAGVERPDRGRIRAFGASLERFDVRARIGFAPEGFPFPSELSGARALELAGRLTGLPRSVVRERADHLLERLGLTRAARRRLGGWSRGMKQRFALAQALVGAPDLLLLDEPTNGLDAPGVEVAVQLLREAVAAGATLVTCSHRIEDLVSLADRLAVLVEGRLALAGTVAELAATGRGTRVVLEDVPADAWQRIERAVTETGGRVVERAPTNAALVALFRSHGATGGDE